MSRNLFLLVLGGLAVAHVMASVGESLIRRGALLLPRDTLDRVWAREARSSKIWKAGETTALVVMVAGLLKAWGIIASKEAWGIPAVAIGFGMFCASSVLRAWLCRAAYAAEAPGTEATRNALFAGILTTLAECAVGVAVCGYIYTHLVPSSPSSPPRTTNATSTMVSTSTSTSTGPAPNRAKDFVSEAEALELLPGKDAKYLHTLAEQNWIRSKKKGTESEYHRDDIIKQKAAGLPGPEELNTQPLVKQDENDKSEKVDP
jgi:hypothetical protein